MADEIDFLFNNVSFETNDDFDVDVLDDDLCENHQTNGFSLVEKMIMKKPANLKAMKSVLSRVWQTTTELSIQTTMEFQ